MDNEKDNEKAYVPWYWTCSWCGVTEMDRAGKFSEGRMYHFGCWRDYQEFIQHAMVREDFYHD